MRVVFLFVDYTLCLEVFVGNTIAKVDRRLIKRVMTPPREALASGWLQKAADQGNEEVPGLDGSARKHATKHVTCVLAFGFPLSVQ